MFNFVLIAAIYIVFLSEDGLDGDNTRSRSRDARNGQCEGLTENAGHEIALQDMTNVV